MQFTLLFLPFTSVSIYLYFSREKENIKGNYEDDVDKMNQQLSNKASIQMMLTEKQNEIQSLKDKIVQVKAAQQDLKENMIQKSKTFAESKHAVLFCFSNRIYFHQKKLCFNSYFPSLDRGNCS